MANKVYVPQQPSKYDSDLGLWVPTINLDPAKRFGELVVLLPPNTNNLHVAPLIDVLREKIKHCSKDDYFVSVGDPTLISIVAILMYERTGSLRMLKWDRRAFDYIAVEGKL